MILLLMLGCVGSTPPVAWMFGFYGRTTPGDRDLSQRGEQWTR